MGSRRITAVLAVAGLAVVLAALLARGSGSTAAAPSAHGKQHLATLENGGRGESEESGGAAAEAYPDRAFPADSISIDADPGRDRGEQRRQGARRRSSARSGTSSGPSTLNVDRLGTQSFIKPTQWSGRVTALTVDPKCKPQECTLYVGAAGGGVWRSKNALAPNAVVEADLRRDSDERDRLDRRRPERPDREDDLRRHRRGERERRQRGRPRPLQDDRRRRALVARARLGRGREHPVDRLDRDRAR